MVPEGDETERNYKTTVKEVKKDLNKWTDIPCSWIAKFNIVKMSVHPKLICRFNMITMIAIKTSARFLCIHKTSSKIHMEKHKP